MWRFIFGFGLLLSSAMAFAHGNDHAIESTHKAWSFDRSGMTSITSETFEDGRVWFEISCPPQNFTNAINEFSLFLPRKHFQYLSGMKGKVTIGSYEGGETFHTNASARIDGNYVAIVFEFKSGNTTDLRPLNFIKRTSNFFVGFESPKDPNDPPTFDFSASGSSGALSKGHCG